MITTEEQNFEIIFSSNFLVSSYEFTGMVGHTETLTDPSSTNIKFRLVEALQFNIESGLDENNIGEIIIPRALMDGEFTVLLDDEKISYHLSDSSKISVISIIFDGKGERTIYITTKDVESNVGGCLIATATFGSELAPQVQFLREIRDNTVLQTQSGITFMTWFNQFYYSFSPAIADYERENLAFKEAVKIILTPLLTSLTLLQYTDIHSESEMLGYGIGIILLNIGMYFVVPAIIIMKIRKRVNIEKLDENYA